MVLIGNVPNKQISLFADDERRGVLRIVRYQAFMATKMHCRNARKLCIYTLLLMGYYNMQHSIPRAYTIPFMMKTVFICQNFGCLVDWWCVWFVVVKGKLLEYLTLMRFSSFFCIVTVK